VCGVIANEQRFSDRFERFERLERFEPIRFLFRRQHFFDHVANGADLLNPFGLEPKILAALDAAPELRDFIFGISSRSESYCPVPLAL
jgi:hypothetical protein